MNSNFEVKHTVRLYDIGLIEEIGRAYERNGAEYRNKNEFMTELIRLGIKAMTMYVPMGSVGSSSGSPPSAQLDNLSEAMSDIEKITREISSYLNMQFNKLSLHISIVEKLLSSIHNVTLADIGGEYVSANTITEGMFDDLPLRFEKLILAIEGKFKTK